MNEIIAALISWPVWLLTLPLMIGLRWIQWI
jgi:hypothetical protein